MEPPSLELVRQLTELELCRPNDLKRARGRVRQLAYDLTVFDSVWIDSLVQLRLITPYQAKQLEEGRADELRIGSFVAIDELGRSDHGTTLLARRLQKRDRCVVKRQRVEADRLTEVGERMRQVLDRASGFAHPQLVLPNETLAATGNELLTVSRFVPGLPLNQLLVRRGRFPAAVVFEIGRQLLDGLAALHARSLVHGDIRMSNVRLTDTGLAVLVEGGMRQVVHPEITIHDTLSLEVYDGIAPDLIGTGAAPTASSEMYALGCLLWQLLAGRPPFTTADPLAKMAAHQTQTIDDVRMWAPETPSMLAETIRQMTSPVAALRPRSFAEILQKWGRPSSFGRSRLKQYRRLFDVAVPHFGEIAIPQNRGNAIWIVAMLFALTGAVAMLYDNGLRNELLNVVNNAKPIESPGDLGANTSDSENPATDSKTVSNHQIIPLPAPGADGVITLNADGPYRATGITFAGNLTIHAANGVRPRILVDDGPLILAAQTVQLENITIQCQETNVAVMVKVSSQKITVSNCAFLSLRPDAEINDEVSLSGQENASLGWTPYDPRDPKSGQITITNTVFDGPGAAIVFAKSPRRITVVNTLKTGSGAFAVMGPKCLATEMKFDLDHMTLRNSGPLLWLAGQFATKTGSPPTQIQANESVFSFANAASEFIVIDAEQTRADVERSIQMRARESIVAPGTTLLATYDSEMKMLHPKDADEQFDGLMASNIEFAGRNLHRVADSQTAKIQGPRVVGTVDQLPGIDPKRLGPAR